MEPGGPGGDAPPPVPEKKKLNRAPSPARPKDLTGWSLSKARRGSPVSLSVMPQVPRRPLPSPNGNKKQAAQAPRPGVKAKASGGAAPRRGTDSSSEGSCASEESSSRTSSEECGVSGASSRLPLSASMAFSDLTEEILDGGTESLLREMEELRSENDYLKDEIEELRSEMLEMRDVYMEEDVYQLQELRQQLEQVHKTCRILQYRLKKSERRGLRVAQTGQVDGELISALEQDVKVAKDVSIRLHNELEAVEKKRGKLEEENEDLRQRLIETDLAKQVLQNEMEKMKENSLKKRGRSSGKMDKKPPLQEDSADIKCQLYFAKEESALMCKKLTKLAKDNDSMKEELIKYRSMFGELDSSLSIDELANSPHSREAELKVHLKLVEEEANILSRRIVELEIESRGLRAEMDEMKVHGDRELLGPDGRLAFLPGESGDNFVELRRHLQFVEEEAELLRRSLMEMEDQNKLLMNELNKYKSDHDLDITLSEDSCSVISEPSQEELTTAKMQISELSGKVKKLQYENRVLLSNLQRYDLASCQTKKPLMETDAEAGDSAQCVPTPLWREGPIGVETDCSESKERSGNFKSPDSGHSSPSRSLTIKELESLHGIRTQAELISKAIEVLTSDSNGFPSRIKLCTEKDCGDLLLKEAIDNSEVTNDSRLCGAIFTSLVGLQQELNCFSKKVDTLGDCSKEQTDTLSVASDSTSLDANDSSKRDHGSSLQQPECRNGREKDESYWKKDDGDHGFDQTKGYKTYQSEDNESYAAEIKDLQLVLSDANETMQGLQEQLLQERQLRKEDEEAVNRRIAQLKEDHQKQLLRRDFQLQSLALQKRLEQKFWSQEKNVLIQETQQFKQSLLLLFMKLKWFLQRWRRGRVLQNEGEDFLEVSSMKELYMLIEEEELNPPATDYKTPDGGNWPQNMPVESMKTLADVKGILRELCNELQDERRGMNELQQQFAKAKAAWEMERTDLKLDSGKHGTERAPSDLKASLKREREEHQHLLAESYSAVMDLTKQLQVSEKNWAQEKQELLGRFQNDRKLAEQQIKELQMKLKKQEESWLRMVPEKRSSCWKEALNDKLQDKDIDCDTDVSHTGLKRAKSVSSMSEFESLLDGSPYLSGKTSKIENSKESRCLLASGLLTNGCIDSDINKSHCTYLSKEKDLFEHLLKNDQSISSWDYSMVKTAGGQNLEPGQKHVQRSHTAPDKTGIRIYYSPPVVRRWDIPLVQNKEKLVVEPGFLFTMAKPNELDKSDHLSGNTCSQWLCNFSKKHKDLLENDVVKDASSAVPGFPPSLEDFEISGNMSDDMKEITNCVRQAIRSSSQERKLKNTSSQTVGLSSVGIQTVQMVSIGLQTDIPRTSLHTKSWSPRGSALLSTRSKHISTSLDKVHSRVERPCCSPKYGSPKLQRRSSSKLDGSKDRSLWNLHQSQKNGSAWARSTTTRDSPVLSNVNDGSSSLFNVVDHAGSTESLYKTSLPENRNKADAPKYGIVQEFFRNVCGRSGQSSNTLADKKDLDDNNKRPDNHDHCSSAVCHPSHNVSKLLSRKTTRQHQNDEQKPQVLTQGSKDGHSKDNDVISTTANVDYACDCTSQAPTSCFSRPSRPHARQAHLKCHLHPEPSQPEEKTSPLCN